MKKKARIVVVAPTYRSATAEDRKAGVFQVHGFSVRATVKDFFSSFSWLASDFCSWQEISPNRKMTALVDLVFCCLAQMLIGTVFVWGYGLKNRGGAFEGKERKGRTGTSSL